MSLELNELVRLVKRAAVEAVGAQAPVAVCYGAVAGTGPLQIAVDQKKTLTWAQIVPTPRARGLGVGEKVVLLRCDGGQKYLVLDRWEGGG